MKNVCVKALSQMKIKILMIQKLQNCHNYSGKYLVLY